MLWSLTSNGRLPWSAAASEADLVRMKREADYTAACADAGLGPVADLIRTMREADRTRRPQYDALRDMLIAMRDSKVRYCCGPLRSPVAAHLNEDTIAIRSFVIIIHVYNIVTNSKLTCSSCVLASLSLRFCHAPPSHAGHEEQKEDECEHDHQSRREESALRSFFSER